jgi:hypothetical protein
MADQRSTFVAFDLDSGGGSENVLGVNLRLTSSGGSIEALGSQLSALSIPVVIASDQGAFEVDTELPAAASLTDDFANPTAPGVGAFLMLWDGATWDRAPGDDTDGLLVNLGANNDVSISGTVTVDLGVNNDVTTELAGSTAVATMADDDANPDVLPIGAYLMGYDDANTNWNRVEVDDAGHLQVDVLTGGGSDTPTNPVTEHVTSASLAAGASADLTTSEAASKKLAKVIVWSSVAYRVRLYTVDNAVESTNPVGVGGAPAMTAWTWDAPHRDYVTLGATAGLDAFRAEVTNLDDNLAADVYAQFYFSD